MTSVFQPICLPDLWRMDRLIRLRGLRGGSRTLARIVRRTLRRHAFPRYSKSLPDWYFQEFYLRRLTLETPTIHFNFMIFHPVLGERIELKCSVFPRADAEVRVIHRPDCHTPAYEITTYIAWFHEAEKQAKFGRAERAFGSRLPYDQESRFPHFFRWALVRFVALVLWPVMETRAQDIEQMWHSLNPIRFGPDDMRVMISEATLRRATKPETTPHTG